MLIGCVGVFKSDGSEDDWTLASSDNQILRPSESWKFLRLTESHETITLSTSRFSCDLEFSSADFSKDKGIGGWLYVSESGKDQTIPQTIPVVPKLFQSSPEEFGEFKFPGFFVCLGILRTKTFHKSSERSLIDLIATLRCISENWRQRMHPTCNFGPAFLDERNIGDARMRRLPGQRAVDLAAMKSANAMNQKNVTSPIISPRKIRSSPRISPRLAPRLSPRVSPRLNPYMQSETFQSYQDTMNPQHMDLKFPVPESGVFQHHGNLNSPFILGPTPQSLAIFRPAEFLKTINPPVGLIQPTSSDKAASPSLQALFNRVDEVLHGGVKTKGTQTESVTQEELKQIARLKNQVKDLENECKKSAETKNLEISSITESMKILRQKMQKNAFISDEQLKRILNKKNSTQIELETVPEDFESRHSTPNKIPADISPPNDQRNSSGSSFFNLSDSSPETYNRLERISL